MFTSKIVPTIKIVRYLQLTLVDIDASLREIIAPETGLAGAHVAAHSVDALLVAAASVLELPALVDVDAAAVSHEPGAVHALLIRRCRHRRRGRFPGDGNRRLRAAITTRLIVADLVAARIQSLRALVHVYRKKKIPKYFSHRHRCSKFENTFRFVETDHFN